MTNKITYTQQGDYLLPNLKLPEQPKVEIGIWGVRVSGGDLCRRQKHRPSRQARQRMNNIRNRAEEIVNSELIYV